MKTSFLYPGQGSQYVGMAKDLYHEYSEVRELYHKAGELLGFSLMDISFEGPEDILKQTRFTQPAIFVHSMAVTQLLADRGLRPAAVAGHSLGEYSALVAAGSFSFEDGLRLVKLRGELMQDSGKNKPGTMAAIIGIPAEAVREICEEAGRFGIVQPANFNSPGQVVISGDVEAVRHAMNLAKEKNARMVSELVVSGAFHSPLMQGALNGLAKALDEVEINNPETPVYSNVTGQTVTQTGEIREYLKQQLLAPVLWQNIIENMISDGIIQFYEIGPSRVLSGINKRINRDVKTSPVGKQDDVISLANAEVFA